MEIATVFDLSGKIIAVGYTGTLWTKQNRRKLGAYDYGESGVIWDAKDEVIGRFENGTVFDMQDTEVGSFFDGNLKINGLNVGKWVGCEGAGALAVIALSRSTF